MRRVAGCVFSKVFYLSMPGFAPFFWGEGVMSHLAQKTHAWNMEKGKTHLQITNLLYCFNIYYTDIQTCNSTYMYLIYVYYMMYLKPYFLNSEESLRKLEDTPRSVKGSGLSKPPMLPEGMILHSSCK